LLFLRGAAVLAFLASTAGTAAAQGRLVAAELDAVLDSAGHVISVQLSYTLQPHGATEVVLAAVRFGEVTLADVHANGLPLTLTPDASGLRPTVRVPLPARDTVALDISYNVRNPGRDPGPVRIPILAVLWPPEQALAGVFVARVSLPAGSVAFDAFPSTLRRTHGDTYETELHVLPAMITFSAAARAPWPSVITGIELLVFVGLVLAGIVGWRRFRAEMR
jgi:hypothetical protein